MIKKERVVTVEGLRDGKGSVEIHHILEGEDLMGHGTMFARVIVKPHSSIGWHQHVGNTEPYYILKGVGTFVDNERHKNRGTSRRCLLHQGWSMACHGKQYR